MSVAVVFLVLPSVMRLFDGLIQATTWKMKLYCSPKEPESDSHHETFVGSAGQSALTAQAHLTHTPDNASASSLSKGL